MPCMVPASASVGGVAVSVGVGGGRAGDGGHAWRSARWAGGS